MVYYRDRVHPFKTYRAPTADEVNHLNALDTALAGLDDEALAEDIQSAVFAIGKEAGYEPLRDWFSCLYQVLLGQNEGPRMGSFIKLYGIDETRKLLAAAIDGTLSQGQATSGQESS